MLLVYDVHSWMLYLVLKRLAGEGVHKYYKNKGKKSPAGGQLKQAGFGTYFFLYLKLQLEKVCEPS